jgi:hypothetical protein
MTTTYVSDRQPEWTKLTAGCGHETAARLSLAPEKAALEIAQLMTEPCIPCVKASRLPTRGITWADVNRGR